MADKMPKMKKKPKMDAAKCKPEARPGDFALKPKKPKMPMPPGCDMMRKTN